MKLIIFTFLLALIVQAAIGDLDAELQQFLKSESAKTSRLQDIAATQKLFSSYKREFSKAGKTYFDEKARFAAFQDTLSVLLSNYQQRQNTFNLKLNNYSDWTVDELKNLRGLKVPDSEISSTNAESSSNSLPSNTKQLQGKGTLPTTLDYSTSFVAGTNIRHVQPIKNQGQCGSCYAFAFVTLLEYQNAIRLRASQNLSEQQIVDCSSLDYGCNGGYFTNSFSYLSRNSWQMDSSAHYPYLTKSSKCAFKAITTGDAKLPRLVYQKLTSNSAITMQQALNTYGPLWVSLFVGSNTQTTYYTILRTFSLYSGGILQLTGCPTSLSSTNHAVVIVGYGVESTTNIQYWKVRNSWGKGWGESGYFRIRRGVNMCGIESGPFYIST